ncbi:MAG: UDP-N-acetylmuramate dehydrogenase [Pseudomonadales bacterium]|nr:UDP-N-acetylmuramate dehydrogenase [Pseudomonadales bacterium]
MSASLKRLNTLGIEAQSEQLINVTNIDQLRNIFLGQGAHPRPFLILGSGSNLVLSQDFPGTVLHIRIKGIEIVSEDTDTVTLSISAGEIWDQLVGDCVDKGYYGLENLSGIPGTVGAAPVQNIGAYGVELEQLLVSVDCMEIATGAIQTFHHKECKFGYRDSVFKGEVAGRYVITNVKLMLSKNQDNSTSLNYKGLETEFEKRGLTDPDPSTVRQVIEEIRQSKLPDPSVLSNAGSFFKNPVISEQNYIQLLEKHPEIVSFNLGEGKIKLAASWMIEKAGWKGFREGDAGVFERHALIIVNHGCATSHDILSLAQQIQNSVFDQFGVVLEIEPVVV